MEDNFDLSPLRKKKKKNSRAKGSTFERKIATDLNKRFNTKEFSRTPGSGAFASTHALPEHLQIHGDLITPANFRYCIECKKGYNDEDLYSLFNHKSTFWGFIEQAVKDAGRSGKEPMLIFKQDRREILAVVPSNTLFISNNYVSIHKENKQYNIYYLKDLLLEEDSTWLY